MKRYFLILLFEPESKKRIQELGSDFADDYGGNLDFARDSLHFTFVDFYLPDSPASNRIHGDVIEEIGSIAGDTSRLSLSLAGLWARTSERRKTRGLSWIVDKSDDLMDLRRKILQKLEDKKEIGINWSDPDIWIPHVFFLDDIDFKKEGFIKMNGELVKPFEAKLDGFIVDTLLLSSLNGPDRYSVVEKWNLK